MTDAPSSDGAGVLLDGRFRLGERLADVGRAAVYRAWDQRLGRELMVTVMRGEPAGFDLRRLWQDVGVRDAIRTARETVPPAALGSRRQKRIPSTDTVQVGYGQEGELAYVAWYLRRTEHFRPARAGEFSRAMKRELLARAGHRCEWCGAATRLRCDHVVPVRYGGGSGVDNGQVLCEDCHRRKTRAEPELRIFSLASTRLRGAPDMTRRAGTVSISVGAPCYGLHEIVMTAEQGSAAETAGRLRGPYVMTVEWLVDRFLPSHADYLGRCRVLGTDDQPCGAPALPGRKLCRTHHRPDCYEEHGLFATYAEVRCFLEQRALEMFGSLRAPTRLPSYVSIAENQTSRPSRGRL